MGDITQIADLYTPAVWIPEMREQMAKFPALLNSGAVVRSPRFDAVASGPGLSVELPFFKDITDQDESIQVESTAPTDQQVTTGTQKAVILNRVWSGAASGLGASVSGTNPVEEMVAQLTPGRVKRRQKALLSVLRGAFGALGVNGVAAEIDDCRLDYFDETGNDATSDQIMNPDLFILGKGLLGELADNLSNGAIWLHPDVLATLEVADKDSFKSGVESGLPFTIKTYRGIPLFISDSLSRAGSTNGKVYETYILAPGVIAYGDKPQSTNILDASSLQMYEDKTKNDVTIFDRSRYLFHLNGLKWDPEAGVPAGQSPTNAELYDPLNWSLQYTTAARCGAVCIRTNK